MLFLLLVSCTPTAIPTKPTTEAPPLDTGTPPDSDPGDSTPPDSEPEPCTGVRLVQKVVMETPDIYDLTAVANGFAVTLPAKGVRSAGRVEVWTLDQGADLDAAFDAPTAAVEGPAAGQYLGVQAWTDDSGRLCSQTYGEDAAGHLYCWEPILSGNVAEVATVSIPGTSSAGYYGYGFTDTSGPHATSRVFDASPPGTVTNGAGEALYIGACGEDDYCQAGARIGDVTAFLSETTGRVYGHDTSTGTLLWVADTGAYTWGPSYVWTIHGVGFLVAVPSAPEMTMILDPADGAQLWSTTSYTAGYAEGGTSASDESIEVLAYYDTYDDGSLGGVQIWNQDNAELRVSLAELLGAPDFDEPYIRLAALPDHPGHYAFATRGGYYAGVVEVCTVE